MVGGDDRVGKKRQKNDFNAEGTRGRKAGMKKIYPQETRVGTRRKEKPKSTVKSNCATLNVEEGLV